MISPSSDETGQVIPIQKNAFDLGGNITENAKNIVANIGKEIENLTKQIQLQINVFLIIFTAIITEKIFLKANHINDKFN